jgi:uncharacterized delta-60 repeat protein
MNCCLIFSIIAYLLCMASLEANGGDLDTTFGTGGVVVTNIATVLSQSPENCRINAIALQTDGKIVAGGFTSGILGNFALARYNADGTLDSSFGTGGVVVTNIATVLSQSAQNCQILSIALQTDGKIVAGGSTSGVFSNFALARYTTDGTLDSSFGTGGVVVTNVATVLSLSPQNCSISSIAVQTDGKIVAGGQLNSGVILGHFSFALTRYNTNGTLDSSFGTDGAVVTNIATVLSQSPQNCFINSIALQTDGKIVAGGESHVAIGSGYNSCALARYTTTGSLDASFGSGGVVVTNIAAVLLQSPQNCFINSIALQADGKIVAGGDAALISGNLTGLIRYTTHGSLDASFGTGGVVTTTPNSVGNSVTIQADEKIIVSGSVAIALSNNFCLNRFNSNGTPDTNFGIGGTVITNISVVLSLGGDEAAAVFTSCIQPNGKIIVAGYWDSESTVDYFALARYEPLSPIVPSRVICTSCGPFIIGKRDCKDVLIYNRNGTCVERSYNVFKLPKNIISGSCTDFLQVTTVCDC